MKEPPLKEHDGQPPVEERDGQTPAVESGSERVSGTDRRTDLQWKSMTDRHSS